MRETRTYGSARGAAGNSRPYRKPGPNSDMRPERMMQRNNLPFAKREVMERLSVNRLP
jgi:hypothetical protein